MKFASTADHADTNVVWFNIAMRDALFFQEAYDFQQVFAEPTEKPRVKTSGLGKAIAQCFGSREAEQ